MSDKTKSDEIRELQKKVLLLNSRIKDWEMEGWQRGIEITKLQKVSTHWADHLPEKYKEIIGKVFSGYIVRCHKGERR